MSPGNDDRRLKPILVSRSFSNLALFTCLDTWTAGLHKRCGPLLLVESWDSWVTWLGCALVVTANPAFKGSCVVVPYQSEKKSYDEQIIQNSISNMGFQCSMSPFLGIEFYFLASRIQGCKILLTEKSQG